MADVTRGFRDVSEAHFFDEIGATTVTPERLVELEKPWSKWLLWSAGFGLFVAILPMFIALIGLVVASAYLQTLHWFLYFSIPAGLVIAIPSGILAVALIIRRRAKRNR